MMYVEVELDGVRCPKRCPIFKNERGYDYNQIHNYFTNLGYSVGYIKVL